jgi:hypothetical protein
MRACKKHVQGVDVIVSGLLKIESVFLTCFVASRSRISSLAAATSRPLAGFGKRVPIKNKARASPKRCVFGEKYVER